MFQGADVITHPAQAPLSGPPAYQYVCTSLCSCWSHPGVSASCSAWPLAGRSQAPRVSTLCPVGGGGTGGGLWKLDASASLCMCLQLSSVSLNPILVWGQLMTSIPQEFKWEQMREPICPRLEPHLSYTSPPFLHQRGQQLPTFPSWIPFLSQPRKRKDFFEMFSSLLFCLFVLLMALWS